ncbi:MAG TPA: hypothetical protein VIC84_06575 [Blastocatellia bacterium]|jgi:hypothetical protein
MSYIALITNEAGHGMKADCKTFAEALLVLTDACETALDSGVNPRIAIARVPPGFNSQVVPVPAEEVNAGVASLLMIPREERRNALEALTRVTESFNRIR